MHLTLLINVNDDEHDDQDQKTLSIAVNVTLIHWPCNFA